MTCVLVRPASPMKTCEPKNKNKNKKRRGLCFSKPRVYKPKKIPAIVDVFIAEEQDVSDNEELVSDNEELAMKQPVGEPRRIVDIFATVSSLVDHISIITTCWCGGVRVHSSCAHKSSIDLPDGTPLCLFDGSKYGVCTSDSINCVPCIVCHKNNETDKHTSFERDFPVGDNWLFREENACPSCLAKVHRPDHCRYCKFCKFDYDTLVM